MKVFTYWSGPVSWMERLCAASARATGHRLTVFTYEPKRLRVEGLDATIEDARDVLCDPTLDRYKDALPSHFSNQFRLEGLAQELGVWTDLDFVFLKPIGTESYLLGWESDTSICGAILRLPSKSPILGEYLTLMRRRPIRYALPWFTWKERLSLNVKRIEKFVTGKPPPRLKYGPAALTHLVRKHGLEPQVAKREVFYPVPPMKSTIPCFANGAEVEDHIAPTTRCVHLWAAYYRQILGNDPPKLDTWLGRKHREIVN
jgi:hypothetical protein